MGRYVGSVLLGLLLGLVLLAAAIWAPRCAHAQATSWPLVWTAAGDDSSAGTAAGLLIFYSATTPDTTGLTAWLNSGGLTSTTPAGIATWINGAKNKAGPAPLLGGSIQTFSILDSFPGGVKEWAMVRTCDDAGVPNCARSNFAIWSPPVLADVWPPRPIRDLRTGP